MTTPFNEDFPAVSDGRNEQPSNRQTASTDLSGGKSQPSGVNVVPGQWTSRSSVRSLMCVIATVILFEFCLYQTQDYFGPAIFLLVSPMVMLIGVPSLGFRSSAGLLLGLLFLTAARLAWCGNGLALFAGFWLLAAFTVVLRGQPAYLVHVFLQLVETVPGSVSTVHHWERSMRFLAANSAVQAARSRTINLLLPAVVAGVFGVVFVLANADVVAAIQASLSDLLEVFDRLIADFSFPQLIAWLFVAVTVAGFCRPILKRRLPLEDRPDRPVSNAPLYEAWRNTLLTVCVVFAAYLAFESRAFIRAEPPEGFTYSSYAHEGAAWLTIALGLSTITLSLIFRGPLFADPRYSRLEKMACVWIALNALLAIAALNRMGIYIGFNGMTRMRVIGLLGITAVVLGLAVVLLKIRWKQDFRWLLRRQSWIAAALAWLYSVVPVDNLIHRYNVSQIVKGNHAPIVQMTAHPLSDECLPVLLPLCQLAEKTSGGFDREGNQLQASTIRGGVQQFLQQRYEALLQRQRREQAGHWTERQWFRAGVVAALQNAGSSWQATDRLNGDSQAIVTEMSLWKSLQNEAYERYW